MKMQIVYDVTPSQHYLHRSSHLDFPCAKSIGSSFYLPVPQDRRAGRKVCDLLTISSEDTRGEKVEGISL